MYAGRKEGAWYRVIFKDVIRADHVSHKRRFENTVESYLFVGVNVCGLSTFDWFVGT